MTNAEHNNLSSEYRSMKLHIGSDSLGIRVVIECYGYRGGYVGTNWGTLILRAKRHDLSLPKISATCEHRDEPDCGNLGGEQLNGSSSSLAGWWRMPLLPHLQRTAIRWNSNTHLSHT